MATEGNAAESEFPGVAQSLKLLAALLVVNIALDLIFQAVGLADRDPDIWPILATTVLSNLIVLGTFMHRRGLAAWGVLHPGAASATAVMGLLTLPVLLLSPALFVAGS